MPVQNKQMEKVLTFHMPVQNKQMEKGVGNRQVSKIGRFAL